MVNNLNDSAIYKETGSPAPGVLIAGHSKEAYGYLVHRSKGTRDWLLTFTLSGEGAFRLENDTFPVREGDIAVLTPGTPHHYLTPSDSVWDFMWVHFVPLTPWSGYLQLPAPAPGFLYAHLEQKRTVDRVKSAFQRLLQDSVETDSFHRQLSLNAMEEMLLHLSNACSPDDKPALDPRVTEVLELLNLQMKENHTISELARKVSLSPSRLSHLFKEQVGDSIVETLQKIRLRHAARLLEYTARPIADIAEDVGYRDAFYFTKLFTAFYGESPSKYRNNMQAASMPK